MSEHLAIRPYHAPNWVTARGVYEKRKRIEAKGLPSFSNWRFITVTLNPEYCLDPETNSPCPLVGYLKGKDHMRRFLDKLRKILDNKGLKWCWKLEFQKNGWAHWHLLVDHREKLSHPDMIAVSEAWGLGRVNIERVRPDKDFIYTFKYAFKPAGDGEYCVPQWFAQYTSSKQVDVKWIDENGIQKISSESKPVSFARVRFWQTSRGFYTRKGCRKEPSKEPSLSSYVTFALSVHIDWSIRKVQVLALSKKGRYRKSKVILLTRPMSEFEHDLALTTFTGESAPLGVSQYLIPINLLTNETYQLWQLLKITKKNRLTPIQAFKNQGQTPLLQPF